MSETILQSVALSKVLSDETRLEILALLQAVAPDGASQTGTQLLAKLHVGQPTISYHLKLLCDVGLVRARRAGKAIAYTVCADGCTRAAALLCTVLQAPQAQQDSAPIPRESKEATADPSLRDTMPTHLL